MAKSITSSLISNTRSPPNNDGSNSSNSLINAFNVLKNPTNIFTYIRELVLLPSN